MTDTSGGFGVGSNTFSNATVTYNGDVGTISYSANGDDVFVTFRVPCYTGPFPYTNSGSRAGICVNNTSFSGNSSNAGVVNSRAPACCQGPASRSRTARSTA